MSAYIVHPFHISTLVHAAIMYNRRNGACRFNGENVTDQNATLVGYALLAANIKSVQTRYPNDAYDELPGPVPTPVLDDYQYRQTPYYNTNPVQILKAISGLEYQCCEYEGFYESPAGQFLDALRRTTITKLSGYDDAEWELYPPAVPERMGRTY